MVTQLKARSTGNPWSLQELIHEVLPDLYLAVDTSQPNTEYQFVTESRAGRWEEVEKFFAGLPPLPAGTDLMSELDDTNKLKFGRSQRSSNSEQQPFWDAEPYSSRRLFQKIVETLRERPSIGKDPYELTCQKTWLLLRGFRFVAGQTHDRLRKAVEKWLLGRIGSADRLAQKRNSLLLDLARRACGGETRIEAEDFFAEHGIDGTPLTRWFELSKQADDYLAGVFKRKGVDSTEDVRPTFTRELMTEWNSQVPIVILTGESGSGKTWHGYTALSNAAANGDIVLLVDSVRSADGDLHKAESIFWLDIAKRDEAPPLSRLRSRLRQIDPANACRELVLLVDNVADQDEARRLIECDWEGWGVRVAITCPPIIAEAVRPLLGSRGRVLSVGNFTFGELQLYLSSVVGLSWEQIPFDIRDTIRRPLLARLFREVVIPGKWEPRNEYELYEKSWERLRFHLQPFDLDSLRALARGILVEGSNYPWIAADLRNAGMSSTGLNGLIQAGWLRETTSDAYEVWHERLLNWTVTEAIVHQMRHHPQSFDRLADSTAKLLKEPLVPCGRMIAYVPMDVLWLLSDRKKANASQIGQLVKLFEATLGLKQAKIPSPQGISRLVDDDVSSLS